jgi:hypothetical protein
MTSFDFRLSRLLPCFLLRTRYAWPKFHEAINNWRFVQCFQVEDDGVTKIGWRDFLRHFRPLYIPCIVVLALGPLHYNLSFDANKLSCMIDRCRRPWLPDSRKLGFYEDPQLSLRWSWHWHMDNNSSDESSTTISHSSWAWLPDNDSSLIQ